MSRNFHLAHVYVPTKPARARVVRAVIGYAKRAGFEQVTRVSQADRVIRLGGAGSWLSIEDDGYDIGSIAAAVATAVPEPILEAYCEASAIVWLGMFANKKRAGGWGAPFARRPAARIVDPLLVTGDAKAFAAVWDDAIRQTFPETALAVAAQHFGIAVERMFGDTPPRGRTIALRRKRTVWKPAYRTGTPSLRVGWGSNQGWGSSHLIFEEQLEQHRLCVTSTGGPGRGLTVRFGGSAIAGGHVEVVRVARAEKPLELEDGAWVDRGVKIGAGLVEAAPIFELGRREADKARAIESAAEMWLDVEYRGVKEGACELATTVETAGGRGEGALDLHVMWRPWRPASALDQVKDYALFAMHRSEHVHAHITLRGSLAEAWAWARPHVEAWAAAHGDRSLHVTRDHDVVISETETSGYDAIAGLIPTTNIPFRVAGSTFVFGTFRYAPYRPAVDEPLVVQLVLGARSPGEDTVAQHAQLSRIADDAIANDRAYSALVSNHQYVADEKSAWEGITVPSDDPLKVARWHETHIRGIDKRIWLSAAHAARIDRAAIAEHATVTPVGTGLRITVDDDRPRRTLAPLEALLAPLLPSREAIEAWERATSTS